MKKINFINRYFIRKYGTFAATAATTNPIVRSSVVIAENLPKLKIEELPVVTDALKKAYQTLCYQACVKRRKEYKLDVTVGDKVGSLFADANGNWIKTRVK
jgi:hypothetical protein